MSKKLYPTDTLDQAQFIVAAWKNISESLAFGPLTRESLAADLEAVDTLQRKVIGLQQELIAARNERDAACIDIWSKVKRSRAGIKAIYGDDSVQYEMAGGTRLSDRKKPRRKVPAASTEEGSLPE